MRLGTPRQRFTELSPEELKAKLGEAVASHGLKAAEFTTMQLSAAVIQKVDDLNANRGKRPAYSYCHLKSGFRGGFFRYVEGQTPVMKSDGVKDFLALIFCLMQE